MSVTESHILTLQVMVCCNCVCLDYDVSHKLWELSFQDVFIIFNPINRKNIL